MTRRILLPILLLSSAWGAHTPKSETEITPIVTLKFFKKLSSQYSLLFGYQKEFKERKNQQENFNLSLRYQLSKEFKLGLSLSRLHGQRHKEDWVPSGSKYTWVNTKDRGENFISPFFQYKVRLNALKSTALKLRLAYRYNNFNENQDLFVRAGLISLVHQDWSWVNQATIFVPLNYSRYFYSQLWMYSSLGYHLNRRWTIGPEVAWWKQLWQESKTFFVDEGVRFKYYEEVLRVGIFSNYYF